tara:strand:+ start:378 stop:998 length:621 start_codon:yes stop_codon:yes gene_type:complete
MDTRNYLIFFVLLTSLNSFAQDNRHKENKIIEEFDSLPQQELANESSSNNTKSKNLIIADYEYFEIILGSMVVYDDNNEIPTSSNIFKLGDYKYEIYLDINPQKYTLTKDENFSREKELKLAAIPETNYFKISDGSIIIGYNDSINLSEFLLTHGLTIKSHFPEINTVVLASNDFSKINQLLVSIRENSSVISAKLNLIDPSIGPF